MKPRENFNLKEGIVHTFKKDHNNTVVLYM